MGRRGASPLLPTVSDTRMLIKASFNAAAEQRPDLANRRYFVRGRMSDTRGEHWHFYATGLQPGRRYPLSLIGSDGRTLSQPWELSTFPGPERSSGAISCLFFTCAGRPRGIDHLAPPSQPPAASRPELRSPMQWWRMAITCIGTSSRPLAGRYTDARGRKAYRKIRPLRESCSAATTKPCSSASAMLQIASIYKTDFRSTPVFFLQDDHDYFDNDDATDEIITSHLHTSCCSSLARLSISTILSSSGCRASIGTTVVVGG